MVESTKKGSAFEHEGTLPYVPQLVNQVTVNVPLESTTPTFVLSPQQESPLARYVKQPVTLASGNTPNYSSALVDGETWYTFSYNIRWNPLDPLYLYVESAMTRFAKTN